MRRQGHLVLADGTAFFGKCLTETNEIVSGEIVFSTSSCGYTEILTDPSYYGQIVVMANPEIGNYGVNFNDFQSDSIKVRGLVVRNLSNRASSFRSHITLSDWMIREQIPVFYGIDTRLLIKHIRDHGAMMAAMRVEGETKTIFDTHQMARSLEGMSGKRLSQFVSVQKKTDANDALMDINDQEILAKNRRDLKIIVLDFGIKKSILRHLRNKFSEVLILPSASALEEIWSYKPDGIFLSNGPGDPKMEDQAVMTIRSLLGKIPIFGVCLGHQILAQSLGLFTYKLKFGHRGSNQAVKIPDGRILTTAQNHGFAVQGDLKDTLVADINVSDQSNEGIDIPELYAFSVQFHPEGAPGPNDALFYFEKFGTYIEKWKKNLKPSSSLSSSLLKPLTYAEISKGSI